jgi:hypothetical protein
MRANMAMEHQNKMSYRTKPNTNDIYVVQLSGLVIPAATPSLALKLGLVIEEL